LEGLSQAPVGRIDLPIVSSHPLNLLLADPEILDIDHYMMVEGSRRAECHSRGLSHAMEGLGAEVVQNEALLAGPLYAFQHAPFTHSVAIDTRGAQTLPVDGYGAETLALSSNL